MNGVVGKRIAGLLNGARAFLYAANISEENRKKLWAEAVNCTEDARNSLATTSNSKSANELFYGKKPSFVRFMVEFGRIGYVTRRDVKMKGKLAERAIKCIMVDMHVIMQGMCTVCTIPVLRESYCLVM